MQPPGCNTSPDDRARRSSSASFRVCPHRRSRPLARQRSAAADRATMCCAVLALLSTPLAAASVQDAPDTPSKIHQGQATCLWRRDRANDARKTARSRVMHSLACSLPEPGKIKVFIRRIFLADDFQKLEGPGMLPRPFARTQRAESLADCSLLAAAGHGDNRARRVNAERSRKTDFILCRQPGGVSIRATEGRNELRREHVRDCPAIGFTRLHNLHQRRTPKRVQSQKNSAKRAACLATQVRPLITGECASARHCPLTGRCRLFKDKRIRRIELDGAQ